MEGSASSQYSYRISPAASPKYPPALPPAAPAAPPRINRQLNESGPVVGPSMAKQSVVPTKPPITPPVTPKANLLTSTYLAFLHCSSLPVEHASLICNAVEVVLNAIPSGVPFLSSFAVFEIPCNGFGIPSDLPGMQITPGGYPQHFLDRALIA